MRLALWALLLLAAVAWHAPIRRVNQGGLRMGIDVSGLKVVPIPPEMMADLAAAQSQSELSLPIPGFSDGRFLGVSDTQNALIILFGVIYFAYEGRPRGNARVDLVGVRKSTIPGANFGVFSKNFVPQGTVLGVFPGFVKKADDALAKKSDDKARTLAKKYMWALDDDTVLDPTNAAGNLDLELSYLGGLVKVDTLMARINEPPRGKDCNVYTKLAGVTVEVIAERDIFADEELFMDYGRAFDRADYSSSSSSSPFFSSGDAEADAELEAKRRAAKKRQEEDAMMRIQPVVPRDFGDEGEGEGQEQVVLDQDTTLADGFLRKLSKNEDKFKKAGILTPEEGANIFAELGVRGLDASREDRELLDAIAGKGKGKGKGQGEGKAGGGVEVRGGQSKQDVDRFDQDMISSLLGGSGGAMGSMFGGGGGGKETTKDEELLASLKKQMGSAQEDDDVPDLADSLGGLFGQGQGGKKGPEAKATESAPPKQPVLSLEEAEDLQRRLDNLTDEQVEAVFARMRAALSDKVKDDLGKAIGQKKESAGVGAGKTMPRAAVNDAAVRSKYASELNAIEDELEKIYSDPLGVWQELMANPEKYGAAETEDDVAKKLASDEELS